MRTETRVARRAAHQVWVQEQEAIRQSKHSLPGVYFIAAGFEMKIGHSSDPLARLSKLQVGCAQPMQLIHVICEPDAARRPALEDELHEKFAAQRIRAEWFEMALPYNYAYQMCSRDCAPRSHEWRRR